MAAEADIIRYMITGEEDEVIPRNATHVSVHPSVKVIRRRLFYEHRNIIELICHDGVIKIKFNAFRGCRRLKRVIMKSVEEIEEKGFGWCRVLEYVECDKLEIIGAYAFYECRSIASINLPSAKTVSVGAFWNCPALIQTKFGNNLESVGGNVFLSCRSLQQITLPLKNGLIEYDNTFRCCKDLEHVDLVEGAVLHETIDALLLEEWKNDMNSELKSINQIIPNTYAGNAHDAGDKAIVIRQWITNVLRKIINYKSQHRRLLKEAEFMLKLVLPHDIVTNNIVPFLTLPQHTFDGEEEIDDGNESIDETYSSDVDSDEEEDDHNDIEGGDAEIGEEGKHEEGNVEERRKRQRMCDRANKFSDPTQRCHFEDEDDCLAQHRITASLSQEKSK